MAEQIKLKGYRESDLEKPKTFREEILERVVRVEEAIKNHASKHWYQVVIECAILASIIYKIVLD